MSGIDPAADVAPRCIAATLGLPVDPWDKDGRQGACDLRYEQGGRSVAVEVKRLVDPLFRAADAAAGAAGYTADGRLTQSWIVVLFRSAIWKSALSAIPNLLLRLEEIGWTGQDHMWQLARIDEEVHGRLERLGMEQVFSMDPTDKHPPGFYCLPTGWGGAVPDVDALPKFAGDMLAAPEVGKLLRQLRNAAVDERHAFLFIGWEHLEHDCLAREGSDLPEANPVLPPPVDGLWLASITTGSRLIAWLPERGWINGTSATAL